LAFLSISLRSTLTTTPLLIREYCPFSFASASVRGKLISKECPKRIGAVMGSFKRTPLLLMFELRPLKNLLASGSQMLTGQDITLRVSLRFSTKVSIFFVSIQSFLQFRNLSAMLI
jgi:hypothetical protein